MLDLSKNILATLCYYDCMDYPLTAFEAWKYLIRETGEVKNEEGNCDKKNFSLNDVIFELEEGSLKKNIEEYQGFYFLKGRKELVEKRLACNKISEAKIKKLRRIVWFLRFVPYFRMAGITGRLAMKSAGAKSDLDLLVVLKSGRIFTGRLLVTLAVHILGKRRYGRKISDRACLNYFIGDESLEIILKDIFSASEYSFMVPVFGGEVFRKFQAENAWIRNYKPNFRADEDLDLKLLEDGFFSKTIRRLGEKALDFDFLENMLEKWQLERIKKDPRTARAGSGVIANREMLVFLPDPKGPKIFEKFRKKLEKLNI